MAIPLGARFILGDTSTQSVAMAISANTSHSLQRALGDEAAEDIMNWMHQTDGSRTELRELNELNYSRFKAENELSRSQFRAEMDARFAQSDARMEVRLIEF